MTNTDDAVLIEDRDGILYVTLNRPAERNALSQEVVAGIERAVTYVHNNPDVRAMVLRGAGGIFCAGGNLKEFKSIFQDAAADLAAIETVNRAGGAMFTALYELPCVLISAVEGAAMGGGVGMAAVADVTIASAGTQFSLTEATLGIPPAQVAAFVAARTGLHQARRLILTAARIDTDQARDVGLVDQVVDPSAMDDAITEVVAQIRRCAPHANRVAKSLLLAIPSTPLNELLDTAASEFAQALAGPESRAGIQAFLTKSAPPWAKEN